MAQDTAVYRLGWYGLEFSGVALAMVSGDAIVLANSHFNALRRRGPFQVAENGAERKYANLRSLVRGDHRR